MPDPFNLDWLRWGWGTPERMISDEQKRSLDFYPAVGAFHDALRCIGVYAPPTVVISNFADWLNLIGTASYSGGTQARCGGEPLQVDGVRFVYEPLITRAFDKFIDEEIGIA